MANGHSINARPGQIAGIAAMSAAFGAMMAMLITPKAGSENRQMLRDQAAKMRAKKLEMKADIDEAINDIQNTADQAKQDIKDEAKKKQTNE